VELLVVTAIISVLFALAMPALRVARAKFNTMKCLNNMRNIGGALQVYANEWKGMLPRHYSDHPDVEGDWRQRLNPYLDVRSNRIQTINDGAAAYRTTFMCDSPIWWCPSAKKIFISWYAPGKPRYNFHYGYNPYVMGTTGGTRDVTGPWAMRLNAPPVPSRTIVIGEGNQNSSWLRLDEVVERTGQRASNHRISHDFGNGANYLFADGHAEYIRGNQGTGPYASSYTNTQRLWRWW
jgi:prepilin-type processing-associated H-X9-DG protein